MLGQKTGSEQPPRFNPFTRREPPAPRGSSPTEGDNIVRLPGAVIERPSAAPADALPPAERWKGLAEPGSAVSRGLDEILRAEPAFDANGFLEGAKAAYEMTVTAFAQGDRNTLKNLLSRDVYQGFERAIT